MNGKCFSSISISDEADEYAKRKQSQTQKSLSAQNVSSPQQQTVIVPQQRASSKKPEVESPSEETGGLGSEFVQANSDDEGIDIISPTVENIQQKEFKSLSTEELISEQQKQVLSVAETLGVTVRIAGVLLRVYRWDREKLFEEFFDNPKKVCKKAGVNINCCGYLKGKGEMTCSVCYDDYEGEDMYALSCKHYFCKDCWKAYISCKIKDGKKRVTCRNLHRIGASCLSMTCPHNKCETVVDEKLVLDLMDQEMKDKYAKFVAKNFVDDNPYVKWCPAPNCGKAIQCPETTFCSVQCSCGYRFCFKCNREDHAPADCETTTKWLQKAKDDSETSNWLVANTKCCPKCKRQIEKNGGCNHMTCSQCRYEFCWVCMDAWSKHGGSTGGFYKCNRFKSEELQKKTKSGEVSQARQALEKYMHYYSRYQNHARSQKFEKQLREKLESKISELQEKNKYSSWIDVQLVQQAADQLIACRNALKYTYVYAYYLNDGKEKNLFEYLQEDLERATEQLSGILEGPAEKYDRDLILNVTKNAERRLDHLLKGVENGLTQ